MLGTREGPQQDPVKTPGGAQHFAHMRLIQGHKVFLNYASPSGCLAPAFQQLVLSQNCKNAMTDVSLPWHASSIEISFSGLTVSLTEAHRLLLVVV